MTSLENKNFRKRHLLNTNNIIIYPHHQQTLYFQEVFIMKSKNTITKALLVTLSILFLILGLQHNSEKPVSFMNGGGKYEFVDPDTNPDDYRT